MQFSISIPNVVYRQDTSATTGAEVHQQQLAAITGSSNDGNDC